MSKINILVVPSDNQGGVGFYRSTQPHIQLEHQYPDEFSVTFDMNPNWHDLISFKKYQIKLKFAAYNIEYKTPLVLILDSKSLGGFKINKGKSNAYDVIILKPKLLNGAIGLISIFLFGYKKTNTIFYDYFNLQEFELEVEKSQDWCLDGEKINAKNIKVLAHKEDIKLYKKVG